MKFSIDTVCEMTGVSAASLRNWEKRYGFPTPERSGGGHRHYSDRDVHFLREALKWQSEGITLQDIASRYSQYSSPQLSDTLPCQGGDDVTYRTSLLYASLISFQQIQVQQQFSVLNSKLSPCALFDQVFETMLRRVGDEWVSGKVSIAQEHFVSAFVRLRLACFLSMEFPAQHQQKIVFATCAGETHEGGLMLLASHLKYRGYPVIYLGVELPIEELKQVVDDIKPSGLCLSYAHEEHFLRDKEALFELGERLAKHGGSLFVGGRAVPPFEQLAGVKNTVKRSQPVFFTCASRGGQAADRIEMVVQRA